MAHATRPEEHAVRRLVEHVWNDIDAAAAHELIAPTCPGLDGTGPEAVLDWHDGRRSTLPDLTYAVDDVVAGSGHAAFRWTAATAGETWTGATFVDFDAKGRIREVWNLESR